MATNYWGEATVSPRELLRYPDFLESFQAGALRIFNKFGLAYDESVNLTNEIWDLAEIRNDDEIELRLQKLIVGRFDEKRIRVLLDERASFVTNQIIPFVTGASLLDIGAGDGMVSWNLRNHFKTIKMVDVVSYVDPRVNLPFLEYADGVEIPLEPADTAILINVLHHSSNPVDLVLDAWKHAAKRLIVIESVYGDPARFGGGQPPFSLSVRQQFLYTSFFDWFYNRVLHSKIPVPFNFAPPPVWEALFDEHGMRLLHKEDLGIDVEIVPIHHYLFTLER